MVKGQPTHYLPGHKGIAPPLPEILSDGQTAKVWLGNGGYSLVDVEDLSRIAGYRWYRHDYDGRSYVQAYVGSDCPRLLMHRHIIDAASDELVDHANGDGLDNRRSNIRRCTPLENAQNKRMERGNSCGFKGVKKDSPNRWRAWINHKGRKVHLGLFETPEEAAHAYDNAARQFFGRFACVNFPQAGERGARKHAADSD